MAKKQVDILIIGGGLTGAALLLALADSGYRTLLVEAKPFSNRLHADFDARSLALSPASVRILQMLGIWSLLEDYATPIAAIHVSEQHRFGSAYLQDDKKEPLGYVVEMQYINHALYKSLPSKQVIAPATLIKLNAGEGLATLKTEKEEITIEAKLIVAADGTESSARRLLNLSAESKSYGQHAIVANIGLARPHHQQAYERFTSSGPMALLPMTEQRASLVWCLSPKDATSLLASSETDFLNALQRAFGYRLGRLVKVGQRVVYPLQQVLMPKPLIERVVFVGNAAHTLHPVAGQGFNLGLRDIAMLAQCIAQQGLHPETLTAYQQARRHDQTAITHFTDGLIALYKNQLPGMATLRKAGLMAIDNIPLLKNLLSRYARGFGGIIPDLVCGMPLLQYASKEHSKCAE